MIILTKKIIAHEKSEYVYIYKSFNIKSYNINHSVDLLYYLKNESKCTD